MKAKTKSITALKIWLVIYPSITLFYYFFGKQLSMLPLYQRTFLLTILLVPWMIFAAMPLIETIIDRMTSLKKTNDD